MEDEEDLRQLHDVSTLPDHGYGRLGQAAHGVLDRVDPGDQPVLALAYNTMPDPPGIPHYGLLPSAPDYWRAAGEDIHRYLALLAHVFKQMPTPEVPERDDDPEDLEPTATRMDALVVVFRGAALRTIGTPGGEALAANLQEGYYRHGDVAASPDSTRAPMVIAVDRDGLAVLLTAAEGGIGPAMPNLPSAHRIGGRLVESLTGLLEVLWSHAEEFDRRSTEE